MSAAERGAALKRALADTRAPCNAQRRRFASHAAHALHVRSLLALGLELELRRRAVLRRQLALCAFAARSLGARHLRRQPRQLGRAVAPLRQLAVRAAKRRARQRRTSLPVNGSLRSQTSVRTAQARVGMRGHGSSRDAPACGLRRGCAPPLAVAIAVRVPLVGRAAAAAAARCCRGHGGEGLLAAARVVERRERLRRGQGTCGGK